ncbi:MAG: hypothetical protein KC609_22075 [Myxococcales bacterium]|nr:hypothetical protein [Myxococcales bacterium]
MRSTSGHRVLLLGIAVLLLAFTSCRRSSGELPPSYPNCSSDYNCADKGEHCVKNKCVKCGADSHCHPCAKCDLASNTCIYAKNCCVNDGDCKDGGQCNRSGKSTGMCVAPAPRQSPTSQPKK